MYCIWCGKEIPNGSKFCPYCGEKQENVKEGKIEYDVKVSITRFFERNKRLIYGYGIWVLIHFALLINSTKEVPSGFYPWNVSLSELLGYLFGDNNLRYGFSWLDEYNVYDFSEFFLYTFLLPILMFGGIKSLPFLKNWLNSKKKIITKNCIRKECVGEAKKDSNNQDKPQEQEKKKVNFATVHVKNENIPEEMLTNTDYVIEETKQETSPSYLLDDANLSKGDSIKEGKEAKIIDSKPMSTVRRLIGSTIDKVLILISFYCIWILGFQIYHGHFSLLEESVANGRLGEYLGIVTIQPSRYEYVDQHRICLMEELISKDVHNLNRRELSIQYDFIDSPAKMGQTKERDSLITQLFIWFNALFYLLSEIILKASPGKRIMSGILVDHFGDDIEILDILKRSMFFLILTYLVIGIHFMLDINYIILILLFFLILDLPILYSRRSLLDIWSNTQLVVKKPN